MPLSTISRKRKPNHREKRAVSQGHRGNQGNVTGPRVLVTSTLQFTAFLPSDAAFLAREKAKADAECYTAMKIAEANKVKPNAPGDKRVYLALG